jgi:LPXTG-motif cell wall-anchored protein
LPAGGGQGFTLDVRIDRAIRNATGTVTVSADGVDPNPANNTATIVINPGPALPAPGLPVTGARTATLAATGALLVILGTIGFALARRRRHRFTSVD